MVTNFVKETKIGCIFFQTIATELDDLISKSILCYIWDETKLNVCTP